MPAGGLSFSPCTLASHCRDVLALAMLMALSVVCGYAERTT